MLTLLGHAAGPGPGPWSGWFGEPLVVLGVAAAAWIYVRGQVRSRGRRPSGRGLAFAGGLLAIVIALASPLDEIAGQLSSAHMVQHVLLIVVAAPLLAWSAPLRVLARGTPRGLHAAVARGRHRLGLTPRRVDPATRPLTVAVVHVVILWAWHAPALYDAAIRRSSLHALEHATFLVSAALLWGAVLAASPRRGAGIGTRILLLFGVTMQGVALALLLTFAPVPWYESYATTTAAWGLDPLTDQHLAGAIMWVPAGAVYLAATLALVARWLREMDEASAGRWVRSDT